MQNYIKPTSYYFFFYKITNLYLVTKIYLKFGKNNNHKMYNFKLNISRHESIFV